MLFTNHPCLIHMHGLHACHTCSRLHKRQHRCTHKQCAFERKPGARRHPRASEAWDRWHDGGREEAGAPGCWGFSLRNKNANPLYSPVDRLYVKQVRVLRSTCVPSIYQLAFLCPALFICSSLNAVAWMSSHIFRRTLLMTMTVLASVLRPHTALMMPPQAERQRELWMPHCPN